jgi:8-oxo-dGTP pyrophosphatase MutT (NUDIX family)
MAVARRAWVVIHAPETNTLLLGKRSKRANSPGEWNLFGGRLDGGEEPVEAACREVEEEIGLKLSPSDLQPLGDEDGHHFFLYRAAADLHERLRLDRSEIGKVKWFGFHNLPSERKHHRSLAILLRRFATIAPAS